MSMLAETRDTGRQVHAALESDVVYLWRANLDVDRGELEWLEDLISPLEREQAAHAPGRYRARLIAAWGIRRALLCHYLRREPRELSFSRGPHGKPELCSVLGEEPELRFNMSHSGGFAIYAITESRRLGVDVEQLRPELADEQTVMSFLAASEVAGLKRLPAHLRLDGFFSCWTRKEAYLKATGDGLSVPVASFAVSVHPGSEAILAEHRDPSELDRWTLRSFRPVPGFIASVAIEGAGIEFRHFDWDKHREANPRMVGG